MILLLRHGETMWNVAKRKQGRGDSPLTPDGRAQVRASARLLAGMIPDPGLVELHTSPLGRALSSTEILCAELGWAGLSPVVDDRLAEYDWGLWQGLNNQQIDERYPGERWKREADKWNYVVRHGESYRMLVERVQPWLERCEEQRTVIAMTHDMVSRVLRGLYLGLSSAQILDLDHPHPAVFCLSGGTVRDLREHATGVAGARHAVGILQRTAT